MTLLWGSQVSSVVILTIHIIVKLIKMTCLDEVSLIRVLPHCCSPRETNREKIFSPGAKNPQRLSSPLAISRQYFKSDFVFCSAIVVLVVNHCLIPGLAGVTVGVGGVLSLSTGSDWQPHSDVTIKLNSLSQPPFTSIGFRIRLKYYWLI